MTQVANLKLVTPSASSLADTAQGQRSLGGSPSRDIAWQRAFERAQEPDFSGWFGSLEVARPEGGATTVPWLDLSSAKTSTSCPPMLVPGTEKATPYGTPERTLSDNASEQRATTETLPASAFLDSIEPSARPYEENVSHHVQVVTLREHRDTSDGKQLAGTCHELTQALTRALEGARASVPTLRASGQEGLTPSPAWEISSIVVTGEVATHRSLELIFVDPSAQVPAESAFGEAPPIYSSVPAVVQDDGLSSELELAGAEGAAKAPPAAEPSPEVPVRLHVEWADEGIRVWIGTRLGQPDQMEQLTLHLQQWFASQGQSLASLVCNGRPVPLHRLRQGSFGLGSETPHSAASGYGRYAYFNDFLEVP
ncbi:hypothetical protein [Holophaga foetida]|uniref:hypothetical protein n=1 Tax=Holophaga foetida TaxID=35839 RepID=UPI0002474652|nr:hypothetical protein [Holophaga foetida]